MRGNVVGLTAKEMEQVKSAFDEVYLQRLVLERQIALVTESNERRVVIQNFLLILALGSKIIFYAQLASQLSPPRRYSRSEHKYGDIIAKLNEGFGNQTRDIVVYSLPDDYVDLSQHTLADDGSIMVTHSQLLRSELDSYVELSFCSFPGQQPTNTRLSSCVPAGKWRRGWDSNPRYLAARLISSQVR